MERRMLPIGIQTLGNIRARNCYYVDKTPHVLRLVEEGTHYFLSRPRRFGKSLLVDTLKELFEGNGELFRGLAIHGQWDWTVKHPVVRFSFSGGNYGDPEQLPRAVARQLDMIGEDAEIEPRYADAAGRFDHLIRALRRSAGQRVVVLVDEYDKPILDALAEPDVARANREFLRGFYGVIKDCDEHIRFCLLTGVSKFSKAGLFSGLNNLEDITLDPAYGTICGYTDDDLDTVFTPELEGLDRDEGATLVQRVQLARGGEGLQPVRHPAAVSPGKVRQLLVRDRYADLSHRDAVAGGPAHVGDGSHDGQRDPAVGL